MLMDSIFATLKSLLWALVLLLMILYGFALVVTQTVSRYVEDKGVEPVHEKLLEFWVTLPRLEPSRTTIVFSPTRSELLQPPRFPS